MSDVETRTARRILLLDCDQFFVQCARLADPDGAGREALLLVGGSIEGRGVVTSASYETRVFGVRSGMPTARALQLCPQARVVPVPGRTCRERSHAVRAVLARFSPVVEPASVDEAYIDLSGTEGLYHGESLEATARRIQETVLQETRIQTSIGGGTGKLIAKLAVERAKPAGVHVVPPGSEHDFLATFELRDLPGVGPVFTEELRRFGLVFVKDAQRLGEASLREVLGAGRGEWLWQKVTGADSGIVHEEHGQKSFSRDETFPRDLHRREDLERELLALAGRLGADLRDSGYRARTISVRLRDADFRNRSASRTLDEPLESDRAIYAVGRELLARLHSARRIGARLIGVNASNLVPEDTPATQLGLFGDAARIESEKDRRLSRTSDQIRDRFGAKSIQPGRLLGGE
jgi:DNA polymerase-4